MFNIFLILLMVVGLSNAFAAGTVMKSNVDGDPPVVLTNVTVLATSGSNSPLASVAENSTPGNFIGIGTTTVRRSADGGITWAILSVQPSPATNLRGIQVLNSGRIIILNQSATCSVSYSDDSGASWSAATISPAAVSCAPTNIGARTNLRCFGTDCYFGGKTTGPLTQRIYKSSDSGATWGSSYSFLASDACSGADTMGMLYFDGTNSVGTTEDTGCLFVSTNNGSSWAQTSPSVNADNHYTVLSWGGYYYVPTRLVAGGVPRLYRTTDFSTWTLITPTYSPNATGTNSLASVFTLITFTDPDSVYLAFSHDTAPAAMWLYYSHDGSTFTRFYTSTGGVSLIPNSFINTTAGPFYISTSGSDFIRID